MKSITLIACIVIITFTLTSVANLSWDSLPSNKHCNQSTAEIEPPTFSYNLSQAGKNTITKERMHNAKSISDLIPDFKIQENLKNNITSVRNVKIRIEDEKLHITKHRFEMGNGNTLSKDQINLLKSVDYSNNFDLEGFITPNNLTKDSKEERYFNYYITVVPEQQVSYKGGNEALIDFLTIKCQATIAKVQTGNLKSGNISFNVTKAGTISDITINSTCGYPSVDEKVVDLLNQLPNGWNVATDNKGEKLNQTLVISFGQIGC